MRVAADFIIIITTIIIMKKAVIPMWNLKYVMITSCVALGIGTEDNMTHVGGVRDCHVEINQMWTLSTKSNGLMSKNHARIQKWFKKLNFKKRIPKWHGDRNLRLLMVHAHPPTVPCNSAF